MPGPNYYPFFKMIDALQKDFDVAVGLIGELAAGLQMALPKEACSPRLAVIAEAANPTSLQGFLERVAPIVETKEAGAAARELRELAGLTWDEAFELRRGWRHLGDAEKQRWARRLRFRRAGTAANYEPSSETSSRRLPCAELAPF